MPARRTVPLPALLETSKKEARDRESKITRQRNPGKPHVGVERILAGFRLREPPKEAEVGDDT